MSAAGEAPVPVIGIGSPFGADRAGWEVVDLLAREGAAGLSPLRCASPAGELLGMLRGTDRAVLVDAVVSGAPPGTVGRWEGRGVLEPRSALSSHGLDVAAVLALGDALGELPATLVLYGIEVDPRTCAAGAPAVADLAMANRAVADRAVPHQAIAEAAARIRAEIDPAAARPPELTKESST